MTTILQQLSKQTIESTDLSRSREITPVAILDIDFLKLHLHSNKRHTFNFCVRYVYGCLTEF